MNANTAVFIGRPLFTNQMTCVNLAVGYPCLSTAQLTRSARDSAFQAEAFSGVVTWAGVDEDGSGVETPGIRIIILALAVPRLRRNSHFQNSLGRPPSRHQWPELSPSSQRLGSWRSASTKAATARVSGNRKLRV